MCWLVYVSQHCMGDMPVNVCVWTHGQKNRSAWIPYQIYVCVQYIYIYICMYVCMYVCIYAHTCIHSCTRPYIQWHMDTHTHTHTSNICMYVYHILYYIVCTLVCVICTQFSTFYALRAGECVCVNNRSACMHTYSSPAIWCVCIWWLHLFNLWPRFHKPLRQNLGMILWVRLCSWTATVGLEFRREGTIMVAKSAIYASTWLH